VHLADRSIRRPIADIRDAVQELFQRAPSLQQHAAEIEKELRQALDAAEADRVGRIEASRAALAARVPEVRPIASEHDGRPEQAADWLLRQSPLALYGLSDGERGLLQRVLVVLARHVIKTNGLNFQIAMLAPVKERLARGEGLIAELVRSLRALQRRLVLSSGRIELVRLRTASALLRAEIAIMRFHPTRQPDLDRLIEWCDDAADGDVRLLHGLGGMGKTRLRIELGDRLSTEAGTRAIFWVRQMTRRSRRFLIWLRETSLCSV
jgi:hypothetical protein